MNIEQARFNMVEQQIRPWDVLNTTILDLLYTVRREDFVPSPWRSLAFVDMELPLEHGEHMLSPKLEASSLGESICSPCSRGSSMSTKARLRHGEGTKSSRRTV